jgi:peptide/nickel transport system substrate-binding protein
MTLAAPALGGDMRARTLRFVPSTDLVSLDPVISTALIAVQNGFHAFDTLHGVDGQMRAQPQMAEGHQVSADGLAWTICLREGLRFHDGEPARSRDCAASLTRWSRRDSFSRVYATAVEAYETPDDHTLMIRLKRPFPRLPDALAKPHSQPAFVMPERIVRAAGDAPITEVVGSGPYRFLRDEWCSGHLVAYGRFDGYRPRSEAPEWTSGNKVAHFERVEWRVIADKSTAVSALIQGEVDWMETVPADLQPLAARNRRIRMQNADPLGSVVVMRFNHLAAP